MYLIFIFVFFIGLIDLVWIDIIFTVQSMEI